jgi:phosphoserine phosphatase RsbU/P
MTAELVEVGEIVLPKLQTFGIKVLLVDDQAIIAEAIKKMLAEETDIDFYYCNDSTNAIQIANEVHPTLILQDLVMPEIDGLVLVRYFRANPLTKDVPLIVLSTEEEPKIKAQAFALGANDYLVKLPDKIELIARIRYHSRGYIRLLERNDAYEKLAEKQKILNAELAEAANYVKSLLPPPIKDINSPVLTNWQFLPSTQLGGDAFGYHWLDSDHFAMYLLDVCGHGVGAALLSISIMNVLRSKTLPDTDFHDPVQVLSKLNAKFPMETHNDMFFTIWYGIYNKSTRQITYSSGGHPPAILFTGTSTSQFTCCELTTPGLAIGAMPLAEYTGKTITLEKVSKMLIFSDGVYEIFKQDGSMMQLNEFIEELTKSCDKNFNSQLEQIIKFSAAINGSPLFSDDYSIVEVIFN